MFAIRARRKVASERDFLDAVEKVVRQGTKFSSTYVSPFHIFFKEKIDDFWIQALVSSIQLDLYHCYMQYIYYILKLMGFSSLT